MATITVKTPFKNRPLQVVWENRKVKIKGSEDAILYWNDLLLRGMYGMFGHRVDFLDTEISDVLVALQNRVPAQDITLDDEARATLKKEGEERKPFPKGAVS